MNETDYLIQRYFDGELTLDERRRLSDLVSTDPEACKRLREASEIHGLLLTLADCKAAQQENMDEAMPVYSEIAANSPKTSLRKRKRAWLVATSLAIAASAVMGIILCIEYVAPKPSSAVARLTTNQFLDWHGGKKPNRHGWLDRGNYYLRAGTARLQTEAGAIVSITAPAEFEIVEADVIRMSSGKLLARMLGEESKLNVIANGLDILDHGTAFGLNTSNYGPSLLTVLDGSIELQRASPNHDNKIVTAGQSMLFAPNGPPESAVRVAFDPTSFEDLWPLTLGVETLSNLVRFLPPGPYHDPMSEFKSDSRIFLMPEQMGLKLVEPLNVEAYRSSRELEESARGPLNIPAGQRIDSYLLFFNPANSSTEHPISISGKISFNRPIIGLILCEEDVFYQSDKLVGLPGLNYSATTGRRGLEVHQKAKPARDIIEVSADGKQLYFHLCVGHLRDQLRVILQADGTQDISR
jgi:hypothetical protein